MRGILGQMTSRCESVVRVTIRSKSMDESEKRETSIESRVRLHTDESSCKRVKGDMVSHFGQRIRNG